MITKRKNTTLPRALQDEALIDPTIAEVLCADKTVPLSDMVDGEVITITTPQRLGAS